MTLMENSLVNSGAQVQQTRSTIAAENWKLLRLFNYYRLCLALGASALALSGATVSPFGEDNPALFMAIGILYAVVALASVQAIRRYWPDFESLATFLAFADIVLLTFILHASGGLSSGLGLLLIVAVAGAGLILNTRLTVFFAALATISVLLEYNWSFLTTRAPIDVEHLTQVGTWGLSLFVTASLVHVLARRLRATEQLAERRGLDLANLSQINALIIQRMQSGALVCDLAGRVYTLNRTAREFLGWPDELTAPVPLEQLSPELAEQYREWAKSGGGGPAGRRLINTRSGYTLLPRITAIGSRNSDSGALVFLEDTAIVKQQAQQLKMAALARLTASIAHEIRNPLGAVSNAAQLLGETSPKDGEEQRLVRIIMDQSRRMNVIVENVTQLARRDRVNPIRLPLKPWLTDFMRQYTLGANLPAEIFSAMGIDDITVCADPDQLYQVVANLCQNALRHSPEFAGQPLIAIKTGIDERDGRPYLDVIDWGTGIPAHIADSIFDPFFTTTPKGTGLGLYIARELCEGNGGRLSYHAGDGVGSRFRIAFARAEECAELATL